MQLFNYVGKIMLNPDLKLNPELFKDNVEKKATRDGFGEAVIELGKKNQNVVVLSADLSQSCKVDKFSELFPQRFFECGVAENNMAGIATGLAICGKIPFACSFAVFSPGKNWETVRTLIAYDNSNVKIAGHHTGLATGPDGATHQATEDIAITRALPNLKVFSPCDFWEAKKITEFCTTFNGPAYIRLTRQNSPLITTEETVLEENKIKTFWVSENPKAVIFVTGYLIYNALLAARELKEEGINVLVANVNTIKPLDEKTVIKLAEQTKAVVTVEDHQAAGGLGGTIAETLAKNHPTKMEILGLKDTFGESGNPEELIEKYGLGVNSIKKTVKKLTAR